MIDLKDISIKDYYPHSEDAIKYAKKIFASLENRYCNEYYERYLPLLEEGKLIKTYIIFFKEKPVGLRVLRKEEGHIFNVDREIYRTTMFRVTPKLRSQGIGSYAFQEINCLIFSTFSTKNIFSESREYGAIRLYSRLENIQFFKGQKTNSYSLNDLINKKCFPDDFILESGIKFIINPVQSS